jgi:hypothetical protein
MMVSLLMTGWLLAAQAPGGLPDAAAPASSTPAVAPAGPDASTPSAAAPAPSAAPAEPAQTAPPPQALGAPTTPTDTGAAAPVAPPREKTFKDPSVASKKPPKPKHIRPWWSWTGMGVGLTAAAAAAAVAVSGAGVQALALYFWYDQTNADRKQAEREAATLRAQVVQWIAVVMLVGGIGTFFGGLIGATYAFGFGNPEPKSAKDL